MASADEPRVDISRTTAETATTGVLLDTLAIAYLALGDVETAEHIEKEILAMPATISPP